MREHTTYWGGPDEEELTHSTPEDAIAAAVDNLDHEEFEKDIEVTVHEYRSKDFVYDGKHLVTDIEDCLLGALDEDYGSREEVTVIPDQILTKINELVEAVIEHWPVWQCRLTGVTETVKAKTWYEEWGDGRD